MSNEEVVIKIYAALNANDIPSIVKHFDPQIERTEWEGTSSAGTFRGIKEVDAHFRQGRSTWAEGSCTPERFVSQGNKVVVFVHVRVRLKDKSEWNEGRIGDVWKFRDGKVIEFRSFMTTDEALHWAGVTT